MLENQIKHIGQILGPDFRPQSFSPFRKVVLFQADEHRVSDENLSNLIAQLLANGWFPRIQKKNGQMLIRISLADSAGTGSRVWVNVILFLVTILTTMAAGAILLGKDYFTSFSNIFYGWKYSFAILTILTAHEFGHYFAAKFHGIKATLPYYLPLPLPGFHFGTLGAFIKMKSPIQNRHALLDVGAGGPLAGFIASLFFITLGYARLPDLNGIIAFVETIHPWDIRGEGTTLNIILGKSLLFSFFNDVLAGGRLPMNEIYHFPFIFAGWIGLLITAINLIPIGQLDGGHIVYALVQKKASLVGILSFALLIFLNLILILEYSSFVWVFWVLLVFFLIGFRHPPTLDDNLQLSPRRQLIGWICLALFILCFPPLPLYIK